MKIYHSSAIIIAVASLCNNLGALAFLHTSSTPKSIVRSSIPFGTTKKCRPQFTTWSSLSSATDNIPSSDTSKKSENKKPRRQSRNKNPSPKRKNRGKHTHKKTSYEKWLLETYSWIQTSPTPLPFEICQNAHDLIRGFTKVFPIGTTAHANLRWDCANKTDYLLKRFIDEKEAGNVYAEYLPNFGMYRLAIEAWATCAHSRDNLEAAKNAQSILDLMEEQSQKHEHVSPPNISCFNALINAYAWSITEEGIEKANEILMMMEDKFEEAVSKNKEVDDSENCLDFRVIKPTTAVYNTLFNAIVKLPGEPKADLAKSILERMERQYFELGNTYAQPTSYSYTSVMSLYTTNGRPMEGQAILEKMEKMSAKSNSTAFKPDTITYNTVMACWANSGVPEAGERAQAILDKMSAKPNRKSYNAVLLAHAKSANPSKAQEILDKMQELWEEKGNNDMKPDVRTFTTVMNAWGRSSLPDAASKAHDILKNMNSKYEATNDKSIKPNKFSYTAVLDAYAFSTNRTDSAERAEELLYEMKSNSAEDSDLKPDVRSHNAVLNAFSRSRIPNAGDRADKILREMEDESGLKPDAFSFNSVILAYVRAHNIESSKKALSVLKRMEASFKSGNSAAKPISNNYNAVISSLATCSSQANPEVAKEVTGLLNTLQDIPGLKADRFGYSAVLFAWSRSSDPEKSMNAYSILKQMRKSGLKPDVLNYITVMNTCAHTHFLDEKDRHQKLQKQKDVFNIAKTAFKEVQADSSLEMNEGVYSVFLRCTRVLIPRYDLDEIITEGTVSTRDKLIVALFNKICEDGLVSEKIVKEFTSKGEEALFEQLFGDYMDDDSKLIWEKLPEEWKCNVGKIALNDWKGNDAKQ